MKIAKRFPKKLVIGASIFVVLVASGSVAALNMAQRHHSVTESAIQTKPIKDDDVKPATSTAQAASTESDTPIEQPQKPTSSTEVKPEYPTIDELMTKYVVNNPVKSGQLLSDGRNVDVICMQTLMTVFPEQFKPEKAEDSFKIFYPGGKYTNSCAPFKPYSDFLLDAINGKIDTDGIRSNLSYIFQ